jgi:hypothetical protein
MKRGLLVGMGLVVVGGVVTPAVTPLGVDAAAAVPQEAMPFDFDGDGYADLAVGVPSEDVRGVRDAGVVQVLYGSASGVSTRDQLWHQGTKGIKNKLERGDGFGWSLTSGDFDADGYADLAVGIPHEDVGSVRDAGAVQVLYGGPGGLTTRDQVWHQGKPGVPGKNELNDSFGDTVAAGDFNADGYADLVVGSAYEAVGGVDQAGWVVVLRGGPGGLTAAGAQSWRQGQGGIPSQPGMGDRFGADVAVGDVNGDSFDDVAILAEAESDIPSKREVGSGSAAHVLFGSPTGLTAAGNQYMLSTDLWDLWGGSFRFRLTFGDFNQDRMADLVLASADGPVGVLHGHSDGLHVAKLPAPVKPGEDSTWSAGAGEEGLGVNVAAGDVTGDGNPDVVVEGPKGSLAVILGTADGLSPTSTRWAIPRRAEVAAISILPFSGGSHSWLATTTDLIESDGSTSAVAVLRGTTSGVAGPIVMWSQDSPGIKGAAEPGDGFGYRIGG